MDSVDVDSLHDHDGAGGEVVSTSDVNLDLDRAGSPVQHRRHRLRGPVIDEDADGAPPLLPPAATTMRKAHAASISDGGASAGVDEDVAFSLQASTDEDAGLDGDDPDGAGNQSSKKTPKHHCGGDVIFIAQNLHQRDPSDDSTHPIADTSLPASLADAAMLSAERVLQREDGSSSSTGGAVRDATRAPVGSIHNSILSVPELDIANPQGGGLAQLVTGRDQDATPSNDGAASPAQVTVLGVAQDLRRKRVKKVSHYILGPLLGEGSYGVVRDAINVSADQKRFSRCAIKMIASGVSASGLANAGSENSVNGTSSRGGGAGRRRAARRAGAGVAQASAIAGNGDVTVGMGSREVSVVEPGDANGSADADATAAASGAANGNGNAAADEDEGPRLMPFNGRGLVRGSEARKAQEQKIFQNEINNLQRFHSKNVIRAIDVFSRYGKEYVVMPIAICSLQQFVRESIQLMREQEAFERAQVHTAVNASSSHNNNNNNVITIPDNNSDNNTNSTGAVSGPLLKPQAHDATELVAGAASLSSFSSGAGQHAGSDDGAASLNLELVTGTPSQSQTGPAAGDVPSAQAASPATTTLTLARRLVQEEWNPAQHYLRDGALFSPILTKGFLYQLLAGVEYLHQQRIAHNDIKPSNLLLFEDGSVKLTDLGSVGPSYTGQGTPLYASPELCKLYYGMSDNSDPDKDNNSTSEEEKTRSDAVGSGDCEVNTTVDPFANDMWCCGLVLYYLITGRPGPLPVHTVYHHYHDAHRQMEEEGALHPTFHMTRWSLYREIASQKTPVDLDAVPDLLIESAHHSPNGGKGNNKNGDDDADADAEETADAKAEATATNTSPTGCYPPNGARDLLSRLLELDPAKRITAEEALRHPWVRMTFKPSKKKKDEKAQEAAAAAAGNDDDDAALPGADGSVAGKAAALKKPPSKRAMEDAIQRDVARRVLQSRHVKALTLLDRQRHLQFAADCCQILGVPLPREILRPRGTEPYEDEARVDVPLLVDGAPDRRTEPAAPPPAVGKVVPPFGAPDVMPDGCVDPSLFLPLDEFDYYEQKCGKDEFDVVVLAHQPMKVRQMEEYLHNVVLVQCGYRTREDPAFAATGRPGGPGAGAKLGLAKGNSDAAIVKATPAVAVRNAALVIRPGGSSLGSGPNTGLSSSSVFSTNSSTLSQLQQRRRGESTSLPPPPAGIVANAASGAVSGTVAADNESSHENTPSNTALPAVTVTRDGRPVAGQGAASNASQARSPAQRARQSARLSQEEAVLAAQEGQAAIKESSKCLCGLM